MTMSMPLLQLHQVPGPLQLRVRSVAPHTSVLPCVRSNRGWRRRRRRVRLGPSRKIKASAFSARRELLVGVHWPHET